MLGPVASPATVWRALDELAETPAKRVAAARATTRARVWGLLPGGLPAARVADTTLPKDFGGVGCLNLAGMAKKISIVDTVVNLCKRRGFVFPSGEIYGGTRSAWDYGPLGVELKENIKRQWWKTMVHGRDDIVGLDSSIILPRQVWVASGHVGEFTDPLTECLSCHKRFRLDHMQEAIADREAKKGKEVDPDSIPLGEIACPNGGTRGQ